MIRIPPGERSSPFVRALCRSAQAAGHAVAIVADDRTEWATATFAGLRHRVTLTHDPALAGWLAALPDAELDVRNAVVVQLTVEAPATIVALVVEADARGS